MTDSRLPARRTLLGALPLAALGLGLAACGTTDPASDSTSSAAAGEKISLKDGTGATVELDGPASKIVALEWSNIDDVISTKGTLVGVADPKGYTGWNTASPLPEGVPDVGQRGEPSLETIAGLSPDLILGIDSSIPDAALAKMKEIAPVLLLKGADATRQLELMRENHLTTGKADGHEDVAKKNLEDLDAAVTSAKEKLAPAAAAPYVFVAAYVDGGQVSFRVHGDRSQPGALLAEAGLKNAWTEPGDDGWGLGTLDLEGMTALPADTRIMYWGDPDGDPIKDDLASNPVWASIPAVQQGHVYRIPEGIWVYGGPKSLIQFLGAVEDVLA